MDGSFRPARIWCCLLAAVAIAVILSACATPTGDWRDDSIGFSPRLADQRLNTQRQELAAVRGDTSSAEIEQATLRQQVRTAKASSTSKRQHIDDLRAKKAAAERKLADVKAQLTVQSGDAELIAKRDALVQEVNELNRHILFLLNNN